MTLELQGVSRSVGGRVHIHPTNLTLQNGTMNVLLGPTLSGKTTLMQLMAGIQKPTSGQIRFRGQDVTGIAVQKRNVDVLAFTGAFQTHLTGVDNLKFVCRVYGVDWKQILPFVEDPHFPLRLAAVDALVRLRHAPAIPVLIDALERSSGRFTEEYASGLRLLTNQPFRRHAPDWRRWWADHGEGFCTFNGLVVAAEALRAAGAVRTVAVLDLDLHYGNGTAALCADRPWLFNCSIYGNEYHRNVAYREVEPCRHRDGPNHVSFALPNGSGRAALEDALERGVAALTSWGRPDLVLYQAGADPYRASRVEEVLGSGRKFSVAETARLLTGRIGRFGIGRSRIAVLEALLRLRQTACHPGLVDHARVDVPTEKLVLDRLRDTR